MDCDNTTKVPHILMNTSRYKNRVYMQRSISSEMDAIASFVLLALLAAVCGKEQPNVLVGHAFPWGMEALHQGPLEEKAVQVLLASWRKHEWPLLPAAKAISSRDDVSATCLEDIISRDVLSTSWGLSMVDSSVKVPIGLAAMVKTHLGNWDQCVAIRDVGSADQKRHFHGQMCMVNVGFQLGSTFNHSNAHEIDLNNTRAAMLQMMYGLQLGICVPSSCSAHDIEIIFNDFFKSISFKGLTPLVTVKNSDCSTRDKPPLDTVDWFAVGVLIFLGVVVLLSTAYDLLIPKEDKKGILASFSVVTNGQKLLSIPRAGGDQALSCLHGIRFISMCWVVLAHRYMQSSGAPNINPLFRMEVYTHFRYIFLTNGTLSVDTFLTVSGLLVGYLFFNRPPAKRTLNIPMYYIHRYIRLTPALAMVVLLTASLLSHTGSGPLWNSAIDPDQQVCRRNWWNTLLYLGNYINPYEQCVSQSWYLMVDMQLHWLSPLVILPLAKWPLYGLLWAGVLIAGGLIALFVFIMTIDMNYSVDYFTVQFYYATQMRFVPYLAGLLVGYYIGELRVKKELKPHSILISLIGWLLAAALMLVPLLVYWEFLSPPVPSRTEAAFYNTFNRTSWGLGVALVVYLCSRGNGGLVNDFLSWWGFQILGRFSYCVYLVHVGLQSNLTASVRVPGYLSDATIWSQFAGDILMSLIFGGLLSVLCESPFMVLEKELLGGTKHKVNGRQGNENEGNTCESNEPTPEVKKQEV